VSIQHYPFINKFECGIVKNIKWQTGKVWRRNKKVLKVKTPRDSHGRA